MQFNSIQYLIFFPVVVLVYIIIPRKLRTIWLLISSYYFYMSWNAKYAILIATSTFLTYICGITISHFNNNPKLKKLSLTVCIIINLGILFVFKYSNFLIESINQLLSLLNISQISTHFDLLLPVGISFYTFQALGYIIDVYRGDIESETNIINYALFVSFFPQLVAGPIERSKSLLSQINNIENLNVWNLNKIKSGAVFILWGLFQKMVIADRAAIFVNTVFDEYFRYGSVELVLAAVLFSLQIYCDFASYSIIAIGSAKIIGIDLMENFNSPYLSVSIRDFWSRWHISLSTWFRDYVYIPLGGNRHGKLKTCRNILIVFLLSGLWHGANWTFVIWGLLHGIYQVMSILTKDYRKNLISKYNIKTDCFSWKLLQTILTFILVTFAWIVFRSNSINDAVTYISRIFIKPTTWNLFNDSIYSLGLDFLEFRILVFSSLALVAADFVKLKKNQTIDAFLDSQNIGFKWIVLIGLLVSIFVFGEYGPSFDPQQFIYFQF